LSSLELPHAAARAVVATAAAVASRDASSPRDLHDDIDDFTDAMATNPLDKVVGGFACSGQDTTPEGAPGSAV
jgi:hypothetical protein